MKEQAQADDPTSQGDSVVSQRYEIEERLGQGGMAEVFRAYDRVLERPIALKRLLQEERATHSAQKRALFEREYHTLSELAHPRIIAVYDFGVDETGPYYAMELLDGGDLRESAPLSWKQACRYLRDVASSLALVHSRRLVHRDVTPRNIRCTSEGRAKLIDFGALCAMGSSNEVVGTAPFVPPEALHGQPLDARTDLFALGATAYFVLTGRNAYPARTLDALPRAWQAPLPPIRRYAPDVPEPLERLVLSLLSLDPAQRPRNAMEVIEQLSAIAGLPDDETLDIQQAFLSTPTLVGRARPLRVARQLLERASEGKGGALLIEGGAGAGRSRLLAACTLQAQLAGFGVIRANATDAFEGEYSVVARLIDELCRAAPGSRTRLGQYVPDDERLLRRPGDSQRPASAARDKAFRKNVLSGLRAWFREECRERPLMVAVDDIHAIDEPSAALLALLAEDSRSESLAVLMTARPEATAAQLRDPLHRASRVVQLGPLNKTEVAELLESVFGAGTPNLAAVTERLFEESQGNPAACVLLAEHLVDRGLATYERGGWQLPPTVDHRDLPAGLEQALLARFQQLSTDARRLAEGLALSDGLLPLDDYARFVDSGDRVQQALDELISHGLVRVSGTGYVLAQSAAARALQGAMKAEPKRTLHGQVAEALHVRGAHPILIAHHLLEAGFEERAAEHAHAFASALTAQGATFESSWLRQAQDVLERAVEISQRLAKPPLFIAELRQALLAKTLVGDLEPAFRHGPALEQQLRRDLGIVYWDDLDASATDAERMQHGMSRAQEAYDATPESERGFAPFAALYVLGRFVMYNLAPAGITLNGELLERLGRLVRPFAGLSPVFELMLQHVDATKDTTRGFYGRAIEGYRNALALLEKAQNAGLSVDESQQIRLATINTLAQLSQSTQSADLAWLDELEEHPLHEASAWRLREYQAVLDCRVEIADEHARRAERVALQNTGLYAMRGGTAAAGVVAAARLDSIGRLRRAEAEVSPLADEYETYQPYRHLMRGIRRYFCGDFETAAVELRTAHERAPIGGHAQAHFIFAWLIRTLAASRRGSEAQQVARSMWSAADQSGFWEANRQHPARFDLLLGTALGEAAGGDRIRATDLWKRATEEAADSSLPPLMKTWLWEYAALVAVQMQDKECFDRCVLELEKLRASTDSPLVLRRLKAILAAGNDAWAENRPSSERGTASHIPKTSEIETALRACPTTRQRYDLALGLLVQATSSSHGFLFAVVEDGLELKASSPGFAPPDTLVSELDDQLDVAALETSLTESKTDTRSAVSTEWQRGTRIQCAGRTYEVLALESLHRGVLTVTGLAALDMAPDKAPSLPWPLIASIARVLAEEKGRVGA